MVGGGSSRDSVFFRGAGIEVYNRSRTVTRYTEGARRNGGVRKIQRRREALGGCRGEGGNGKHTYRLTGRQTSHIDR